MKEVDWKDEEFIGMIDTVNCLRSMRTAATKDFQPFILRTRNLIQSVLGGEILAQKKPQKVLFEAEKLADSAASFFATRLQQLPDAKEKYETWRDFLSDYWKHYSYYSQTTFARTSTEEVVTSLINRCRNLMIDPNYMLKWELTENNHLGAKTVDELIDHQVGVFSPLSGDYLTASTYSRYLLEKKGKTFSTHAVALRQDLEKVVFPENLDSRLDHMGSIGIYLDTNETGRTAHALHKAILKVVGDGKRVHKPKTENTDFKKSQKIRKFWNKV